MLKERIRVYVHLCLNFAISIDIACRSPLHTHLYPQNQLPGRTTMERLSDSPAAPISALPAEILSEIFIHYAHLVWISNPGKVDDLLRVCRFWSDVARATPQVWAHICISDRLLAENSALHRRVARSLALSGTVPVVLRVSMGPAFNDDHRLLKKHRCAHALSTE